MERRDKRGRRIGRNWWREFIMSVYYAAENDWLSWRESGDPIHTSAVPGADWDTAYYQLTDAEYKMIRPRPTLKDCLIVNKGVGYQERYEECA